DFGWKTCDGTGPFRFVESVPGSHFDVARWDGSEGAKTRWEANRGPAHLDWIRWISILDDRDRATALEYGYVDCIQNASLFELEAVVLDDATVRRVSATIKKMLEEVGIRLTLVTIPGFADFYARLREHPQAFISKWFWPEPVDAIIGFIASWGRDGGPNFQGS